MNEFAAKVAAKAIPQDSIGFDPMMIAAIVSALAQLIPLIQGCRESNELPEHTASRLAQKTIGWRMRQWRLRRIVRSELGIDADRDMVCDVAEAIMELGQDPTETEAIFAS